MGTRHLIAVVAGGDFKVAQYGQWDGYPDGQGYGVLDFLTDIIKADALGVFRDKVLQCHWLTKEEAEVINAVEDWPKKHPQFSRDTGSDILKLIYDAPSGLALKDTRGFAGDSLFCEWAYVIDLDTNVLEVYQGFNKEPTPADSRFPSGADWLEQGSKDGEYQPVKLVKSYPLDALPTKEQFLADLTPPDEEEAA